MSEWQPIETAPKRGGEFLATDGTLLGVGWRSISVQPETVVNYDKWNEYYKAVHDPFRIRRAGMSYLEQTKLESEAWDKAKAAAPAFEVVPNPKAGEVEEHIGAFAFHAFDGIAEVQNFDGPVYFRPTHWMPLPDPPTISPASPDGN